MKKFLLKIVLFSGFIFLILFLIFRKADGYTDAFYLRFTSPRQTNLILGTSRSAQAIQPKVLKDITNTDFFNYSFTIAHSPYGPAYLKSIKKKFNKKKDGVFILTIDPWSISSVTEDPNDVKNFRENDNLLNTMKWVNSNPNFEYLIKNLSYSDYKKLFSTQKDSILYLHKDGWLEVSVPMDSVSVQERLESKLKEYREKNLSKYHFSELRLDYLKQTIEYLNPYAEVFLVRLPVHPDFFKLEKELIPDFDEKIENLTKLTNTFYWDMNSAHLDYDYVDGNHLYKKSGEKVSREIGKWINEKRSK